MDLLEQECPVLCNMIILQTVMEEARNQNLGITYSGPFLKSSCSA